MAKTVLEPKVGQYVYRTFQPAQAGVIKELIDSQDSHYKKVKVKWIDGRESIHSDIEFRDFDALIEETRKKLNTHLATLEKLKKL